MLNRVAVGLAALFMIIASSLAYAEAPSAAEPPSEVLSDADWKALTDRRIEIVKAALQLTPEQAKYWPAIEEAVRDRANVRHLRLQKMVAHGSASGVRVSLLMLSSSCGNAPMPWLNEQPGLKSSPMHGSLSERPSRRRFSEAAAALPHAVCPS